MSSDRVGNGGIGLRFTDEEAPNIYLLDLVERSVHRNPYFKYDQEREDQRPWVKKFREHFSKVGEGLVHPHSEHILSLLANKILEIREYSPAWAYLLRKVIFQMEWHFTSEFPVRLLADHTNSLLGVKPEVLEERNRERVGLAARQGAEVMLDLVNIGDMNAKQVVALILHEATYALTPPYKSNLTIQGVPLVIQEGSGARRITASYFDPAFQDGLRYSGVKFRQLVAKEFKIDLPEFYHLKDAVSKGVRPVFHHNLSKDSTLLKDAGNTPLHTASIYPVYGVAKTGGLVVGMMIQHHRYYSPAPRGGAISTTYSYLSYYRLSLQETELTYTEARPEGSPPMKKMSPSHVEIGEVTVGPINFDGRFFNRRKYSIEELHAVAFDLYESLGSIDDPDLY